MTPITRQILIEALAGLEVQYNMWLKLNHTTDNERELAIAKIDMIHQARAELGVEAR